MKTFKELSDNGLKILSLSSNGEFKVTSYIGKRGGKKVYGYFDHKKQQYVEN